MLYISLFLLITGGYIFGAPIFQESLHFRIIECIPGENDTLSSHVLEVTNINETCIKVNKTSPTGNEINLHIVPATETGVQIHITTENCSTPLPDLHLSFCDNEDDNNNTQTMISFQFVNITDSDIFNDFNDTTTPEMMPYTGPTVYETLHHLDYSDEEEDTVTLASSINVNNGTNSTSSSESSSSEVEKAED